MPIQIPDLWGDQINVDVLPPLVILKAQGEALSRKTKGILRTEVSTTERADPKEGAVPTTTHTLDLVAPALGYSESLLEISHQQNRFYPAQITVPDPIRWDPPRDRPSSANPGFVDFAEALATTRTVTASYAEELLRYLGRALQSRYTKSAIDSLLAMSNERRMKSEPTPKAS